MDVYFWLSDVEASIQDTDATLHPRSQSPSPPRGRKRTRSNQEPDPNFCRMKRTALAMSSGNAMTPKGRASKKHKLSQDPQEASPPSTPQSQHAPQEQPIDHVPRASDSPTRPQPQLDPDSTPRAGVVVTQNFHIPPPFPPPGSIRDESSPRGQPSLSDASSTTNRTRSISPRKAISQLEFLDEPVVEWSPSRTRPLPACARDIWRKLIEISDGSGVLSKGVWETLKAEDSSRFQSEFFVDLTNRHSKWSKPPPLDRMKEIVEDSQSLYNAHESEPGWNGTVHTALCNLANRCSSHWDAIKFKNVTQAKISTKTVLPSPAELSTRKSMVDLLFALEPDDHLLSIFRHVDSLDQFDMPSLNHTDYSELRARPIAISIETKKEGEGRDKASYQLMLWAAAHLKRLRLLCVEFGQPVEKVRLPALPLLMVQGAQWRTCIATQDSKGATTIWQGPTLGDTWDWLGAYKVCAGLQFLLHWGSTELRTWFDRFAIDEETGACYVRDMETNIRAPPPLGSVQPETRLGDAYQ